MGESIELNQIDKLKKIFGNKKRKLLCVNDSINIDERNIILFKKIIRRTAIQKSHLLKNER